MIKVSIIVPVYNVAQYLPRCLDSLVNQSLQEIEIITVDDQSPDQSIEILKDYKKGYPDKIKVIQSDINRRQGGARNLGIRAASGDFIGFVDSDDWAAPTMFEKLYNAATETQSDVADCNYYLAFSDHEVEQRSNSQTQCGQLDIEKKKSLVLNPGRTWTKLYKRELFTDNQIYFPEHLFYEDNEIMPLLMAYTNKLVKIPECLYYYFVGSGGSTTEKRNSYHHFDRLQTSINMLDHFKQRNLMSLYGDEISYRFTMLYYFNTIQLCLNKFDPPEKAYLKKIRDYMHENYRDYRKNPYFKRDKRYWNKFISQINDCSPNLAIVINRLIRGLIASVPYKIRKKVLSPRSSLLEDQPR